MTLLLIQERATDKKCVKKEEENSQEKEKREIIHDFMIFVNLTYESLKANWMLF